MSSLFFVKYVKFKNVFHNLHNKYLLTCCVIFRASYPLVLELQLLTMNHSNSKMKHHHIYFIQILFVSGITIGSQNLDMENRHQWAAYVARYVLYLLTIDGTKVACQVIYDMFQKKRSLDVAGLAEKVDRTRVAMVLAAAAVLFFNKQAIFAADFPVLFVAYLIVKYPEIENVSSSINYGVGMACSFFEGYLVHIIPSDGHRFVGFEENIRMFEASQGVVFPVKRLFLVITKTLHCPPDLKQFNKPNRPDLPWLDPLKSLEEVEKDVAGVKNRTYRNSAYKIYRPRRRPVCLAVECATPLHTLGRVLQNRQLYEELSSINVEETVEDFCRTLRSIVAKSPECRDKCEMVYFDDTDPQQNLADILLDKIREIEPNFENIEQN